MAIFSLDVAYTSFESIPARILLAFLLIALVRLARRERYYFPVVNEFPWDFTQRKAYAAYAQNAKNLVQLARERGPIIIKTPSGPRTILPSSLSDWVKSNKDLDHQELVRRDFMANYPGFEANAMIHHPNKIMIDTIKRNMSQNERLIPIMDDHASEALDDLWTLERSWHTIEWPSATTSLISRTVAAAFVGPEMARDREWQDMTIAYATNFFAAVFELRRWPSYLRPLVHWFLPGARKCRMLVKSAREAVDKEKARRERKQADQAESQYIDAMAWTESAAAGKEDLDQGAVQLGFAVAALHTTSEALRHALLDLCRQEELTKDLRDEIEKATSFTGITLAALSNMKLLDSVLKESQRLHPPAIVNLERQAIRNTHLPDGTPIPRGTIIDIDGSDLWNPRVYSDPDQFDGYRFLKMREAGDDRTAYVSSTKEQCVFGMGRHICPGRFLAAVELKICLAHILLRYELRLKEGYEPVTIKNGFFQMADPGAQVEVKRREEASSVLGSKEL